MPFCLHHRMLLWSTRNKADQYQSSRSRAFQKSRNSRSLPDADQSPLRRLRLLDLVANYNKTSTIKGAWSLRARLVERRAIKYVVRHEHESPPHGVCRSDPIVTVGEGAVLIAPVIVQRSLVPHNDVPVRNRW